MVHESSHIWLYTHGWRSWGAIRLWLEVALHQNANGFLVIPGPSLEGVPTMHADVSSVGRLWEVYLRMRIIRERAGPGGL